jgi:hypothetical protein
VAATFGSSTGSEQGVGITGVFFSSESRQENLFPFYPQESTFFLVSFYLPRPKMDTIICCRIAVPPVGQALA